MSDQVYFDIFYKIHFSIIISPAREWYLSGYGNNTADCGDSRENACKTLDHLLGLFHKSSFKQNQTLVLITNETLLINTKLMVSNNVLKSVQVIYHHTFGFIFYTDKPEIFNATYFPLQRITER